MIEPEADKDSFDVLADGQSSESWDTIITQFADASIYQSWAYGAVRWGQRSLSHIVLRRNGRLLAAAQLRLVRAPCLSAGIAYLRWGPMCQPKAGHIDPMVVSAMVSHLQREYGRRRRLVLQIIPQAFAGSDRAAVFESAFRDAGLHPETSLGSYRTVMVDLAPPSDVIRKRLDQKWRNQLNRSEKNGLAFEVSDGAPAYGEFTRLYAAMWERKRFETSVDVTEFARIQELLTGSARMQTFLARKDGEAIGAAVCSLLGDTAIYLLGATDERAREIKAAYYLHWQAMLWLKQQGARWYDLGGIDPDANPGGHHFKSGFGGHEVSQLSPHASAGGAFGHLLLRLMVWRGRRHAASLASSQPAS